MRNFTIDLFLGMALLYGGFYSGVYSLQLATFVAMLVIFINLIANIFEFIHEELFGLLPTEFTVISLFYEITASWIVISLLLLMVGK